MQPDDTICYCFHVTKRKIVNFIRVTKPSRVSQVSGCGGAGTGCGWCVPFLRRYFEALHGKPAADQITEVPASELSPAEYARQRQQYIAAGKGKPPAGAN